jgi:hypothetical protein
MFNFRPKTFVPAFGSQRDPEKFKLNKEGIQAIAFVNEYYPLNPL